MKWRMKMIDKNLKEMQDQNKKDAIVFINKYCKKENKTPQNAIQDLLVKIVVKENYNTELTEADFINV
jgi:hypothetical protein